MFRYGNKEIMDRLNIDKIVKTREVFCTCDSNKVVKLYADINTSKKTAYNNKTKEVVTIDEYTDIDIDYCKDCGRVDYIMSEQGFADSYRVYFKKGHVPPCSCGTGNIDDGEGYAILLATYPNGDIVFRNRHCMDNMLVETRGLFGSQQGVLNWLNEVAKVKVNPQEAAFYKEQAKIQKQWEELAKNNGMNIYTLDDLEEKVNKKEDKSKIGRNDKCPCGSGKKYKKCCGAENKSVDMNRPIATQEDLVKHINEIEKVWNIYKTLYVDTVSKNNGMVSVQMINDMIIESKQRAGATKEADIAIEGFFDSYVAQLNTIKDSNLVHEVVDTAVKAFKKQR